MTNLMSSTVLAVMISVATVAPSIAEAGDNDVAKLLAGLVALGVVAKVVDDRNDRKRAEAARRATPKPTPPPVWGRIEQPHRSRAALPAQCERRVITDNGAKTAYGRRCLLNNYRDAAQLPSACERRVQAQGGYRTVYGARCLRQNGFAG